MQGTSDLPLSRDLVLVGGGHAHALVLRRWGMRRLAGARLTVVDPGATAPYTGMLPGLVAGHYRRRDLEIDLGRLARHAGARLILGRAEAIDRAAGQVWIAGRGPIAYDALSLDIGVTSAMPELPGFAEHAVPAKPLGPLADAWLRFTDAAPPAPRLVVIGGGVAGVELAMAMAWRLRALSPQVTVLESGRALAAMPARAARLLRRRLAGLGVTLREGVRVEAIAPDAVLVEGGEVPSQFTVGAAGARPHAWLSETGLDLTDGYVTVGATLASVSDPAVFAAGDCAHMIHTPRPKAGVYAVRQAPVLHDNLRATLSGGRLRVYRPQGDYLKLVSLGRRSALAEKWGLALAAPLLWQWKDRIDRRFMARLAGLRPMPGPSLPKERAQGAVEALGSKPMCGGCGAKVGGGALAGTLTSLSAPARDDVLSAPGDDAAVLAFGTARQVLTTDHLRAVTADPWVMARIAAVHAMGDVWAMGARPQAALATVVLPRLAPALQERWLDEIMTAATEVFAAEGAAIVGGHTTVGAELTLGFTVTGLLDGEPVTLAGAAPGDVLLLTKPIGSGTVLAAEMALEARGEWVAACLDRMVESQGAAARLLNAARAMTDVTGFGLAGHLGALCRASDVAAEVDLGAVPLLPGALDLAARGVRSTLYEANVAFAGDVQAPEGPLRALLFDPQTSGGLLAALPADAAPTTLAALRDAGYEAARIGRLVPGPPKIVAT